MEPLNNPLDRAAYQDDKHQISPITGYCERCGAHQDEISIEHYLCLWGENVLALSHRRRMQILEKDILAHA